MNVAREFIGEVLPALSQVALTVRGEYHREDGHRSFVALCAGSYGGDGAVGEVPHCLRLAEPAAPYPCEQTVDDAQQLVPRPEAGIELDIRVCLLDGLCEQLWFRMTETVY